MPRKLRNGHEKFRNGEERWTLKNGERSGTLNCLKRSKDKRSETFAKSRSRFKNERITVFIRNIKNLVILLFFERSFRTVDHV